MEITKYKYRIWCKDENRYVHVWDTETPTQCPNDSNHTIFTSTITVTMESTRDPSRDMHISISGNDTVFKYCSTTQWEAISNFIFPGTKICGEPVAIKIIALTTNSLHAAYFRLVDSSNGNEIVTWGDINNVLPNVYTDYSIANLPEEETVLELQGKSFNDTYESSAGVSSLVMIF